MRLWILRGQSYWGPIFTSEDEARAYLLDYYQHASNAADVAAAYLAQAAIVETNDPAVELCDAPCENCQ